MRKLLFSVCNWLIVISVAITSCTEETSLNISAIILSESSQTLLVGDQLEITAKNQDGLDITDLIAFSVNGSGIEGSSFTAETVGDFTLSASYEEVTSANVLITVIRNITSISVEVSKNTFKPIDTDSVVYSVLNQDAVEVTDRVQVSVNGETIADGYVKSDMLESFTFVAKYEALESAAVTVSADLNPTKLTLIPSNSVIYANNYHTLTFQVLDEDEDDLIDFVEIYEGSNLLVDHEFVTGELGTYSLKAKYENVESEILSVESVVFRGRKVLIEEFTGEWCGWCPQAAYNLENLVKENDQVYTVGIHNGDDMAISGEGLLRSPFGLNYFPSGLVGRVNLGDNVGFNGCSLAVPVTNEVNRQINEAPAELFIGMETSIGAGEAVVDVQVDFVETMTENLYLTVYLIENDVIGDVQANYFAGRSGMENCYYYDQPGDISGYVHQFVLRKIGTDLAGDMIPSSETTAGNSYAFDQISMSLTGYNSDNCEILAFVHYDLNGDDQRIINVQSVKVGGSIGFLD